MATSKFKELEIKENQAIEKLKVTQTTHASAQIDLERVIQMNQDVVNQRR